MSHDQLSRTTVLGFICWLAASLGLVALCIFSPTLLWPPAAGVRLGVDHPVQLLQDPSGHLTVEEVARMPDAAFTPLHGPLNQGYSRSVYWLRASAPQVAGDPRDPLWLEVTPSYLDKVTLYQPSGEGAAWQGRDSGDTVPMTQRVRTRQLLFPFAEGQPLILRVQTTSASHAYAVVQRNTELIAHLVSEEWAAGAHLGINLLLALLLAGAALALRIPALTAMTAFSAMAFLHSLNVQGYALLWLPEAWAHWSDRLVSVGVFLLPAASAWQVREVLTRGTRWRRVDKVLAAMALASLAAIGSIPLGGYTTFAAIAIAIPWISSMLATWVGWTDMRRDGLSTVGVLLMVPYTNYALMGGYVALAAMGILPAAVHTATYWQLMALLLNIVLAVAVGLRLVQQFRASAVRQRQLVESLERSEQSLEERVRQRTEELLHTQNALQAALHSEREIRQEQRQFFNMVNHEFRTPLTVIDSAATEQWTFPSPEIAPQVERAAQIRRACRRLTALVENCLVNDRLDAPGFTLHPDQAAVHELLEDAAQLVHWSRRHRLQLRTQETPAAWSCDTTLVHIALSNLVDNAVKHAKAGDITVAARLSQGGALELSVADEGPGLAPEEVQRIFERFERGRRSDQTRGFGLGLWVARRVAQLHGGDVRVDSTPGGSTCFTLVLPPLRDANDSCDGATANPA